LLCSQPNSKAGHLVDLVYLKQKHSAIKEPIVDEHDYKKIDDGVRNSLQIFLKQKASHNFSHVSSNDHRHMLASKVFPKQLA